MKRWQRIAKDMIEDHTDVVANDSPAIVAQDDQLDSEIRAAMREDENWVYIGAQSIEERGDEIHIVCRVVGKLDAGSLVFLQSANDTLDDVIENWEERVSGLA